MKRGLICCLCLLFGGTVFGQNPSKEEVLTALNGCATYATDVLLDEEGKSRCDYNMILGEWFPYEEPWHTGQIILGLLDSYKVTGNQKYLDAAKRAGEWWIGLEIKDHPVLKGMVAATHGDAMGYDNIVFATTSDGTPGIFELSRVTGDKKYARVATSAAKWMLEHMYNPKEGVCYDLIDIKTGEVIKEGKSGDRNMPLEEVSRPNTEGSPFKDAYEFSGEESFRDAHVLLCNSLVEKQGPEGVWMDYGPNHKSENSFHPRFNLWYAESLLDTYELTKDRKYLEAAAKTARLYAKAQRKDGTIYYDNYLDGSFDKGSICGSAVAFAGIVWMRLAGYGYDEFVPNYEKSAQWLITNRYAQDHPDPNVRGAVVNTRYRVKKGREWMTKRDVGTSFALRFLAQYYTLKFEK